MSQIVGEKRPRESSSSSSDNADIIPTSSLEMLESCSEERFFFFFNNPRYKNGMIEKITKIDHHMLADAISEKKVNAVHLLIKAGFKLFDENFKRFKNQTEVERLYWRLSHVFLHKESRISFLEFLYKQMPLKAVDVTCAEYQILKILLENKVMNVHSTDFDKYGYQSHCILDYAAPAFTRYLVHEFGFVKPSCLMSTSYPPEKYIFEKIKIMLEHPGYLEKINHAFYSGKSLIFNLSDISQIKYVVEKGADPFAVNKENGNTLLHEYGRFGREDLINFFINELHLDPLAKNNLGKTPFIESFTSMYISFKSWKLSEESDFSLMSYWIEKLGVDKCINTSFFITRNKKKKRMRNLLHYAIYEKQPSMIEFILPLLNKKSFTKILLPDFKEGEYKRSYSAFSLAVKMFANSQKFKKQVVESLWERINVLFSDEEEEEEKKEKQAMLDHAFESALTFYPEHEEDESYQFFVDKGASVHQSKMLHRICAYEDSKLNALSFLLDRIQDAEIINEINDDSGQAPLDVLIHCGIDCRQKEKIISKFTSRPDLRDKHLYELNDNDDDDV